MHGTKLSQGRQPQPAAGTIEILIILQDAPALPKTRSGKIMRRILRKIAADDKDLGDTSTMADPSIIPALQQKRNEVVERKK